MASLNSFSEIGSPASKVSRVKTGDAVIDSKLTHDTEIANTIINKSGLIFNSILPLK